MYQILIVKLPLLLISEVFIKFFLFLFSYCLLSTACGEIQMYIYICEVTADCKAAVASLAYARIQHCSQKSDYEEPIRCAESRRRLQL